jgi:hypothetical protein
MWGLRINGVVRLIFGLVKKKGLAIPLLHVLLHLESLEHKARETRRQQQTEQSELSQLLGLLK